MAAPALTAAAAGLGCAYLAVVDPNDPSAPMPMCPTKLVTGLDCPACGGLRMVRALLHGQWSTALRANAFLLLALPLAVVVWARWYRAAARGRRYRWPARPSYAYAIAALAIVWMVLRNLPAWPLHPGL